MIARTGGQFHEESDRKTEGDSFRIHLHTLKEEDGSFSTVALNLPGAGSCGSTVEESIENAQEAIRAVLEVHKEAGDDIPWRDSTTDQIEEGQTRWIILHV